jgi:hypothetical protein
MHKRKSRITFGGVTLALLLTPVASFGSEKGQEPGIQCVLQVEKDA